MNIRVKYPIKTTPLECLHNLRANLNKLQLCRNFNRTLLHLLRTSYQANEALIILTILRRKLIGPPNRNSIPKIMSTKCNKLSTCKINQTTCMRQPGTILLVLPTELLVGLIYSWISSKLKPKRDFKALRSLVKNPPKYLARAVRSFYQLGQAFKAFLNWNLNYQRAIAHTRTKTCLSSYHWITQSNLNRTLTNSHIREWIQCKTPAQ